MSRRAYYRPEKRREGKRDGKLFFVATDGKNTEPLYLQGLERSLNLKNRVKLLKFVPKCEGCDPVTLVRKVTEGDFLKKNDYDKDMDEVWFVFDWESEKKRRSDATSALSTIKENKYCRADSDLFFEQWLLFHFENNLRNFQKNEEAVKALKKYLPQYSKSKREFPEFPSEVFENIGVAIKNSESGAKACEKDGKEWPTHMHELVKSMENASVARK